MKEEVKKMLEKRANQVANAAVLIAEKTMDWQHIKAFLTNRSKDLSLTPTQQMKMERYQFVYNHLITGKYSEQDVVKLLQHQYKIESSQAYEDVKYSKEIFVTVINLNKLFDLNVELQVARRLRNKAEEMGNFKAAEGFQKNIIAILTSLPDVEENAGDIFEGHLIEATFDPALIGAPKVDMKEVLRRINEKRNAKINTEIFEELNYQEIKSDEAPL